MLKLLRGSRRTAQRGDTLIEVLFALTVFSLIVVASMSLMNQGTATSQRALEISLASQAVDNQAEALRYLHDAYVTNYQAGYASTDGLTVPGAQGQFYTIVHTIDATRRQATAFGGGASCPLIPDDAFVINTRSATVRSGSALFSEASTYPQLVFQTPTSNILTRSEGLWIEGVRSTSGGSGTPGYIDFHIRACWNAPGLSVPSTVGTIVRLYEPRG